MAAERLIFGRARYTGRDRTAVALASLPAADDLHRLAEHDVRFGAAPLAPRGRAGPSRRSNVSSVGRCDRGSQKPGFATLGRNINPSVVEALRVAMRPLDRESIDTVFRHHWALHATFV
ncbi:MAG TPA: hypothetical protein VNJ52_07595 [Patescibacteria group bacterium]|nr:hypothetical protein [Patescibacteria group bacterium]